jgi:single-stranded-DNA-specific exonuclease
MRAWIEPDEVNVPDELKEAVGGHPLVAKTLARRGFLDASSARAFLDPLAYRPTPPLELPGMQAAAGRLERAIQRGEAIFVWGDFDVDGQTSTTLLVSGLRDLGAQVNFHIPVREYESHGVNLPGLMKALESSPQVLLTCDTGIASHQAVDYARAQGVDVIITDHHELPPELPQANAIVNPKMLPEGHPLGTLPGVGVAYKLVEELYQRAGRIVDCDRFLDLAALGIVADIAIQRGDARYLVQRGLEVLRNTQRLGLQVLMEQAELNPAWLTEEHIGFVLGPRLNALGRLADANLIVEFFTTQDIGRARILALQLDGLNERRKLLTNQVFQGALAQIEGDPSLLEHAALVLAHPAWPAGVIGIVASRLVERYNKPTVLIAAPPDELARGSARSIEGVDITAAIATQEELLEGFGGHPMAAGLSMNSERIPEFRRGLSRTLLKKYGSISVDASLKVDAYLPLDELSLELVADLERLAPFGAGNPPLVLASRGLNLTTYTTAGRDNEHLLLTVEDKQGASQRVVWWQGEGWPLPEGQFDLAYSVRASTFRGQRQVQVEWVDARTLEELPAIISQPAKKVEVIDYRQEAFPLPILQRLQAEADLQVWGEAEARDKLHLRDRNHLEPSANLAVWTSPPGQAEWRAGIEDVDPERVYLFGLDPHMDDPNEFLKRLAGLVKYALSSERTKMRLSDLAAATAQREKSVEVGLAWLEARGYVQLVAQDSDEIIIGKGNERPNERLPQITAQLKSLLAESAAYRAYFVRTDKNILCVEAG